MAHAEDQPHKNLGDVCPVVEQEHEQPLPQIQGKPASCSNAALFGPAVESGEFGLAVYLCDLRVQRIKLLGRHACYGLEYLGSAEPSRRSACLWEDDHSYFDILAPAAPEMVMLSGHGRGCPGVRSGLSMASGCSKLGPSQAGGQPTANCGSNLIQCYLFSILYGRYYAAIILANEFGHIRESL